MPNHAVAVVDGRTDDRLEITTWHGRLGRALVDTSTTGVDGQRASDCTLQLHRVQVLSAMRRHSPGVAPGSPGPESGQVEATGSSASSTDVLRSSAPNAGALMRRRDARHAITRRTPTEPPT